MREKWQSMTFYRRAMLLATVGLMLLFAVLYPIMSSQKGLEYENDFYKLNVQGEAKVYTGFAHEWRIGNTIVSSNQGRKTVYTVTETPAGYTVGCQIEGESFGPYQLNKVRLSDLPAALAQAPLGGGLEIKNTATGEVLFRGGYLVSVGYLLVDENAVTEADKAADPLSRVSVNGFTFFDYKPAVPEEGPGPDDLVHFTLGAGENLTHRGEGVYFVLALLVAVFNAVSILYAEELFTWQMSFRVAEPEKVEPSEWELFGRHVGWCLFLLMELTILLYGLFAIV